jgi:hypothetical protein
MAGSAGDAAQAAVEQELVVRTLEEIGMLVQGMDLIVAMYSLRERSDYSALRTRVEQARVRAEQVLGFLRSDHA